MYYLYVKQHTVTGLKYFGKTRRKTNRAYYGSGKYWKAHLKKHGRFVTTLKEWCFDNQNDCTNFAIQFSRDNDIVNSEEWANLIAENGVDGGWNYSVHTSKPGHNKGKKFGPKPEHIKKRVSENALAKYASGEWKGHRLGMPAWNKGRSYSNPKRRGIPMPTYTCPHCQFVGKGGSNMRRWHFDNCKRIKVEPGI